MHWLTQHRFSEVPFLITLPTQKERKNYLKNNLQSRSILVLGHIDAEGSAVLLLGGLWEFVQLCPSAGIAVVHIDRYGDWVAPISDHL